MAYLFPSPNLGYQRDDQNVIDYGLTPLPEARLMVRGPVPHGLTSGDYFTCLGAAQTFGRFCERPYPTLVSQALSIPALNLGFAGAGPGFFLTRSELIDFANRGRFAVLQVLSGRSISNSVFECPGDLGLLTHRRTRETVFAEVAYIRFLRETSPEHANALRMETRSVYSALMRVLLAQLRVPTILFYYSTRAPEYVEGTQNIGTYLSGFPHFINREVLNFLAPQAAAFVEAVGSRGLPQKLFNRETGMPEVVYPEARFPDIRLRDCNNYYPSPEMHEDAAGVLVEAVRRLKIRAPETSAPAAPGR